jgi:hypothetical protein
MRAIIELYRKNPEILDQQAIYRIVRPNKDVSFALNKKSFAICYIPCFGCIYSTNLYFYDPRS